MKASATELVLRAGLRLAAGLVFRMRVLGRPNIPAQGPALLVSNHVSYLDPVLIWLCLPVRPTFLLPRPDRERLGWLARKLAAIEMPGENGPAMAAALDEARRQLQGGRVVVVFGEGMVSRTGHLLPFLAGLERLVEGVDAPVIPVHLEGLSGAWLSYWDGQLVRRLRRLPRPALVHFGKPLASTAPVFEWQQALMELACESLARWHGPRDRLERRFIAAAKRNWGKLGLADSSGRELSFGRALTACLLLARWLRRNRPGEAMVGILLPASAAAALANMAVLMSGKVPVNLNFTAGGEAMQAAIRRCRLATLLTSRQLLSKANLAEQAGMVFLEDLIAGFKPARKLLTGLAARLAPARLLERLHGGRALDEAATVVFSSGSTGEPKGAVLSHRNIITNLDSMRRVFKLGDDDRLIGVLPFFHVFGFTCTLCFPLAYGLPAIYHPNPTDARAIGELTARYRGTLLIATPTFFNHYLRRCSPEEFSSLRYAIAGGEKLPRGLAKAFEEKFGLPLLEGYGTTELSPVVAVNVPDLAADGVTQRGLKPGTVGRLIPGVAVRIVDPSSGQPLGCGQQGLLVVKSPGCMLGYFEAPERTREVLREGWYWTGDIAALDEEGFLTIADRLARFSKIGGEMVPHMRLEQAISDLLGGDPCVVTAVPDPVRGERLVVLYTRPDVSPAEIRARLQQTGLPRLWIPKQEDICWVQELPPPLPSGKLDLRRVHALAVLLASRRGEAATI